MALRQFRETLFSVLCEPVRADGFLSEKEAFAEDGDEMQGRRKEMAGRQHGGYGWHVWKKGASGWGTGFAEMKGKTPDMLSLLCK